MHQFTRSVNVSRCRQSTTMSLVYKMRPLSTLPSILLACQLKIIRVVLQLQHN